MRTERDAGQRGSTGGLRTTLLVGAGAIALFAIGGVVVIWAMGDAGGPPSAVGPEPAADPVRPAAIAAAPVSPAPSSLPPRPAAIAGAPAPAPEELDPSWRDIPVVFRTRDGLGAVGGYVFAGLRAAQEELKHCRPGGATPAAEVASPALVVLYLQSRQGAIDVVDVRTEDAGGAHPEFVDCCRAVLRGYEFRVPNAQPGRRYRLKYAL